MATRPTSKRPAQTASAPVQAPARPLWLLYLLGWLVPGAAHLWLGRRQKGLIFVVALPVMFIIGLVLQGRLFTFDVSEPLVALAAIADIGMGVPYAISKMFGLGIGQARALTYDYGNTFIITAGLLNALVIIDAHDVALRRK